jgi:uncharacterized lipoprotein YmbA
MRNSLSTLSILLMAALASLTGCGGKVRYPSYYVLNLPAATPAANQSAPILGPVVVREFDAPRFLRGGSITYRESPEKLGFYEYAHWAVDPRRAVTGEMIQQMRSSGLFRSVDTFDGHGSPECMLTGAIDHLEEVDEGRDVSVEVAMSARLTNLRTGEVLWQGASSKKAKVEQRSVPGMVAEMSREVADIVEGLVSSMQGRVSAAALPLSRSNTEQ